MCRNIRPLYNVDPPVTEDELQAAALQFVRKITGMNKPSAVNQQAFDQAVAEIAHTAAHLMDALTTRAPSRNREVEAAKARARAAARYAS